MGKFLISIDAEWDDSESVRIAVISEITDDALLTTVLASTLKQCHPADLTHAVAAAQDLLDRLTYEHANEH